MKMAKLFAAASIAIASLSIATAADAQPRHQESRGRHNDHGNSNDRGSFGMHDNGNHYGQRKHGRQTCRTVYRHGHRQRVCR